MGLLKSDPIYLKYIKYRNCYNKIKRKAKSDYYYCEINKFRNNSKKLWALLKNAVGKLNDKISVINEIIDENGINECNSVNICNKFNNFFGNIGKQMA
jgi:hypothetical protein